MKTLQSSYSGKIKGNGEEYEKNESETHTSR